MPLFLALLPKIFIDCVVAIGVSSGSGSTQWVATGFMYGDSILTSPSGKPYYAVYLVTNRHVFDKLGVNARLRFNPESPGPAREYVLVLQDPKGTPQWVAHPNPDVDVACISMDVRTLNKDQIDFSYFRSNIHVADRAKAVELGLAEGDGVFVLGFPMGLVLKKAWL